LGQGFPSFGSPPFLRDIIGQVAIGDQFDPLGGAPSNMNFQYSKPGEEPELAGLLAERYTPRLGQPLTSLNLCTTVGAQEAIFTSLAAFCDPGDEVAIITPAFDAYFKSASILGLHVKSVPVTPTKFPPQRGEDLQLCLQALRETLTPQTKFLLLNTPSSPLGKVFSKEELEEIAGVVREFPNLMVLSDEVYEHMVFEGLRHEHFASLDGMFDRTVTLFSVGKTFSCTGWRLGYAIGPSHMIHPIKALHAAVNFSTATPLQKATARAFTHADETG
jgi:aspartate/methionine/tyrosine aminotransferase